MYLQRFCVAVSLIWVCAKQVGVHPSHYRSYVLFVVLLHGQKGRAVDARKSGALGDKGWLLAVAAVQNMRVSASYQNCSNTTMLDTTRYNTKIRWQVLWWTTPTLAHSHRLTCRHHPTLHIQPWCCPQVHMVQAHRPQQLLRQLVLCLSLEQHRHVNY